MNEEVKDMFLNKKTFENRRRMAWISLFAILLIVIASFWLPTTALQIESVIETIVMTLAAVIMTYMGTTMLPVAFTRKTKPPEGEQ